jgi:acyl phosphate:glycerol-3-phosphate acyltransferase
MPVWLILLIGYLLGAIPTAYIAGRVIAGKDIRRFGDENSGAANAYRELGAGAGVLVGVVDAAKGAAAVMIAQASNASIAIVMLAGLAAVAGHNWPVFLGFRGGRGVSTVIGILFSLATIPMLIMTIPTMLILIWRKNVTPSMAFLFIILPLVDWWLKVNPAVIIYGLVLPAIVGVTTYFRIHPKAISQGKNA